jgi:hypothetical protein
MGFFASGLGACVSGEPVSGHSGGNTGSDGDGGSTGTAGTQGGQGGTTGGGQGGRVGTGGRTTAAGGKTGTGAGGQVIIGSGGQVVLGSGGATGGGLGGQIGTCPSATFTANCTPTCALISDMEDGNNYYGNGCPKGAWYLDVGGGGTPATGGAVTPVAITDRPGSTHAIHVSGMGQTNAAGSYSAHVTLSASLNSWQSQMGSLNATAFTGVKFWYKVTGPIELHVPNKNTSPMGGVCMGSGTAQCYDDGKVTIPPSATWVQIMVPFSTLMSSSPPFGTPAGTPFPADQIYNIEWHVTIASPGMAPSWDIWIDDLSFY